MPRLERVLETCLYAENLDAAEEFYAQVLDLPIVSRGEGRHVFFRLASAMFLLFHPGRTSTSDDVPPHGASGPGHVAFAVEEADLPGWRARFAACGVAIEREVSWPSGGHSLYVRDPAGNSVELATPGIWPLED